jgi:hypothetical protein
METNVPYDVSEQNIKIKSYNHTSQKIEMKKILNLVKKPNDYKYQLVTKNGDVLLECSGGHRIFDGLKNEYFHVSEILDGKSLNNQGKLVDFFVKKTDEIIPIVDMQVEDNSNYFTNGILSHNTTAGGESLKYYASIRCRVSTVSGSTDTAKRTKVKVIKNKTAVPFKETEFNIIFGVGIDKINDIVEGAIDSGLFQKGAGGVYTSKLLTDRGVEKIRGREKLLTWIKEQGEDFLEILSKEAREFVANQSNNFTPTSDDNEEDETTSGEL